MTAEQERQLEILQGNYAVFQRRASDPAYPEADRRSYAIQAAHVQRQIESMFR